MDADLDSLLSAPLRKTGPAARAVAQPATQPARPPSAGYKPSAAGKSAPPAANPKKPAKSLDDDFFDNLDDFLDGSDDEDGDDSRKPSTADLDDLEDDLFNSVRSKPKAGSSSSAAAVAKPPPVAEQKKEGGGKASTKASELSDADDSPPPLRAISLPVASAMRPSTRSGNREETQAPDKSARLGADRVATAERTVSFQDAPGKAAAKSGDLFDDDDDFSALLDDGPKPAKPGKSAEVAVLGQSATRASARPVSAPTAQNATQHQQQQQTPASESQVTAGLPFSSTREIRSADASLLQRSASVGSDAAARPSRARASPYLDGGPTAPPSVFERANALSREPDVLEVHGDPKPSESTFGLNRSRRGLSESLEEPSFQRTAQPLFLSQPAAAQPSAAAAQPVVSPQQALSLSASLQSPPLPVSQPLAQSAPASSLSQGGASMPQLPPFGGSESVPIFLSEGRRSRSSTAATFSSPAPHTLSDSLNTPAVSVSTVFSAPSFGVGPSAPGSTGSFSAALQPVESSEKYQILLRDNSALQAERSALAQQLEERASKLQKEQQDSAERMKAFAAEKTSLSQELESSKSANAQLTAQLSRVQSALEEKESMLSERQEKYNASNATNTQLHEQLQKSLSQLEHALAEKERVSQELSLSAQRHKHESDAYSAKLSEQARTLEEAFKRQWQVLQDELAHGNERQLKKLAEAEENKRVALLQTAEEKRAEIELVKVQFKQEIEELRHVHKLQLSAKQAEYEQALSAQQRLRESEIQSLRSTLSGSRSLNELIEHVKKSVVDVETMQERVDTRHVHGLEARELAAKEREARIRDTEDKLARAQQLLDQERYRVQETMTKLEAHMRDSRKQIEQDMWRVTQDSARLQAQQEALDTERARMLQQVSDERADLQKEKEEMVSSRKTILLECQEERRQIAKERAELRTAQKKLTETEKRERSKTVEMNVEIESATQRIQRDAFELEQRAAAVRRDHEKLRSSQRDFRRAQDQLEEERAKLFELAEDINRKSQDLTQMFTTIQREKEVMAQKQQSTEFLTIASASERSQTQEQLRLIAEKERLLAAERLVIARERKEVHDERHELSKRRECGECHKNKELVETLRQCVLRGQDPSASMDEQSARGSDGPLHPSVLTRASGLTEVTNSFPTARAHSHAGTRLRQKVAGWSADLTDS
eukprot:m.638333 g.638333  ORF g.638333 m.638333 type:complete len:1178 (-) comp58326_c0_seq6:2441-5974(-)